jgi:hypothetical protein
MSRYMRRRPHVLKRLRTASRVDCAHGQAVAFQNARERANSFSIEIAQKTRRDL